MTKAEQKKADEKIILLAKERFKSASEFWNDLYTLAKEDLVFLAGDQWPTDIKNDRKANGRPLLTINKMQQFVRSVTNEARQNKPSAKVYPVDDQADVDTAKVFTGVIKNIEYSCDAPTAYNLALEDAAKMRIGFNRIVTEYENPNSFKQILKIKPVYNPLSVLMDIDTKEIDGSDMNWGFFVDEISKELADEKYGEIDGWDESWEIGLSNKDSWYSDKKCRLVEYYYKDFKKVTLYRLGDGSIVTEKPLDGVEVVETRESELPAVKWCHIAGSKIVERGEWAGSYIPIIPFWGARYFLDGKWHSDSVISNAKDSQRMYNYMKSYEAEAIALAPRVPWVIEENQIPAAYVGTWQTANQKSHAFLPYKGTTVDGNLVPAPQRNSFEPAVAAITQAAMLASDDIKATTGIYDASLGARSNEQSGIAIARRNAQAQTANYHIIDNQAKSIRHIGKQLVELIPIVYEDEQVLRMIGEDGTPGFANVNGAPDKKFNKSIMLNAGQYDVVVEVGPSYATKRQESAAQLIEIMGKIPTVAPFISDLAVKSMDIADAATIAERLKKMLPPQLQDNQEAQVPPQVQAMMAQMQAQMQELQTQNQSMSQIIANKQQELDVKVQLEVMKIDSHEKIELAKLNHKEALEVLTLEMMELKEKQLRQDEFTSQFEIEDSTEFGN